MKKARGSIWSNTSKKKGFSQSIGSYGYNSAGDRYFKLTPVTGGKSKVYESPQHAEQSGWFIVEHGK